MSCDWPADVYYAWGVSNWNDFDFYEGNSWLPYAAVAMYPDGSLYSFDTSSGQSGLGTYNKQGKFLDLEVAPGVFYSGERVSRTPRIYVGQIIVNGQVVGLWRGYFS